MAKTDTRKCRYTNCFHENKDIDLTSDKYIKDGSFYYHEDCYKVKQDIQQIKTLWHDHIDGMVVYSQLMRILNQLIFHDKVSSDYLVFAVKYAINHDDIKLRYPPGIRYVIGNQKVKDAYTKSLTKTISNTTFVAHEDESTAPKFSFNRKPTGFGSILGG